MTQEKEKTFENCRCPKCKRPFDFVPLSAYECPFCKWEIRRSEVWKTRRYPGILIIPGWAKAFGWPLLLMLAGVAFLLYCGFSNIGMGVQVIEVSGVFIGTGLIFFLFKLNTNGEA